MEKIDLKVGDVLQLNPEHKFGGMLVICTEPKQWGCQGYLMSAYDFEAVKFKGKAFVRPKFEDMEFVGRLEWIFEEKEDESSSVV